MVWPVHCQLGSWGHGIHHAVLGALERWQRQRQRAAMSVIKGTNPYTEHYSALQAEVPDPQDPSTQLNMPLLERIAAADQVVIAGEASSHCVAYTARDLFAHLPAENLKHFVLLTDCMSPVSGFEQQHAAFLQEAADHGVLLTSSGEFQLPR